MLQRLRSERGPKSGFQESGKQLRDKKEWRSQEWEVNWIWAIREKEESKMTIGS